MSQYINFYVKGKSGKRIPIGSYSRNSTLFKQCREFVPFEATAPLNNSVLEQIISSLEKEIIEEQQSIILRTSVVTTTVQLRRMN